MRLKNIKILHWDIFKDVQIKTGITTRLGGVSKPPYSSFNLATHTGDDIESVICNRSALAEHIDCKVENYTHGNQVHGDYIHKVDSKNIGDNSVDCDALITDVPDTILNIYVADCVPIAIYDPVNNVGGLCHCGWKGTFKKLLPKTITRLNKEFGSRPENLLIGIGPSIGICCYEVSKDLYNNFMPQNKEGYIKNNKYYLNLKEINKNQVLKAGIIEKNIEVMDLCTFCNSDIFFSYRKEGEPSGRFSCYLSLLSKKSAK